MGEMGKTRGNQTALKASPSEFLIVFPQNLHFPQTKGNPLFITNVYIFVEIN